MNIKFGLRPNAPQAGPGETVKLRAVQTTTLIAGLFDMLAAV
jgi:hypothetical protein